MSPAAISIIEHVRQAISATDELEPHEADLIIGTIVSDLRSRRPMSVAPLSAGFAPTELIRDPRKG